MALNQDDNASSLATAQGPAADQLSTTYTIYPNQLQNYASFIYNIKLQATTTQLYNLQNTNQFYDPTIWTTICQSGGVGPIRAQRPGPNPGTKTYFNRDLFIDELEFQTFVGMTQETRGTNVTEVRFTITEPNGMDFIEELFDFCHDKEGLQESNYTEIPLMLVIVFKGYDDTGAYISADFATKYIPITLLNMEVSLGALGATYKVSAIPLNDLAFTMQYGYLPLETSIKGTTLNSYVADFTKHINDEQQEMVQKGIYQYPDKYTIEIVKQDPDPNDKSLTLVDLGTSTIGAPQEIATKDVPYKNPPSPNGRSVDVDTLAQNFLSYRFLNGVQTDSTVISIHESLVQFQAGSSITDCINQLILSSKYITDQVAAFQKNLEAVQTAISKSNAASLQALEAQVAALNVPFQWFKIICDNVTYGEYDELRNTYAKNITYKIKPYIIDNSRSPLAPSAEPITRVLKEYNYILTGKNTEVIDFNINFNTAFINFSQINLNTKQLGTGAKTAARDPNARTNNLPDVQTVSYGPVVSVMSDAKKVVGVPYSNKQMYGTGQLTVDRSTSADVMSTLYSRGDLLILDLTIMGDPDYIKQDAIFRPPLSTLVPYVRADQGQPGGILFDAGSIYFNMNFLIPVDYNLNSGLMDVNGTANNNSSGQQDNNFQYKRNIFSGLYEVISVANSFRGGAFTQQLQARRIDDSQVYGVVTNTVPTASGSVVVNG